MKIFFWIMWCSIFAIELFLLKGLLNMIFHKYNPINVSSVTAVSFMLLTGGALLAVGYYCYQVQKMLWACGIVGLPLMGIILYFMVFLILPYIMDERMN